MLCPRRSEIGGVGVFNLPDEDAYHQPEDTCTYCGSLNPDTFMARLEASSCSLDPTDKDYKVYVVNKGGTPFVQRYRTDDKPFFHGHDSPDHTWETREMQMTKFYFQHLSQDQQK